MNPPADLPKLPVARALWDPKPNLKVAAESWILAGGAHYSVFSQALTPEYVEDYCEMAGIGYLLIDEDTEVRKFKQELRLGEIYYHIAKGRMELGTVPHTIRMNFVFGTNACIIQ